MSRELLDKAKEYARLAQAKGADAVRAEIYRNRSSSVEWLDGNLDRLRESTEMGLSAALFVDGRYAAHTTNDLRPEAVESFLEEAVAMTRLLAPDPHRRLPDPARYAGLAARDLGIHDEAGLKAVTGVNRRRAAQSLEESVRSAPGAESLVSITASAEDQDFQYALVNSNGMEGMLTSSVFALSADVTIKDQGDLRQRGYGGAVTRARGKLPSVEEIGSDALFRARRGLGARPIKSGQYRFVMENQCAARLLGWVGRALTGHSIQQNQSFLAEKAGQQIASPVMTVMDEPHLPGGLGSRLFDDEGMACRRMPIIEKGVLRNFYIDTYYASKLGVEPTTGTTTNLVYDPGSRDLDGLLRAMGTGILVTEFVGGNSNPLTGDYSVGIRGQWVEDGRQVHPIVEMNLSGSFMELLMDLEELGNDVYKYSSTLRPSMRFAKGMFSGA